jgi:hypothetical protein
MFDFENNKQLEISQITSDELISGSLEKRLPEVYALKENYEKNPWHDESTFEHTMMVFEEYKKFFDSLVGKTKEYFKDKISNEQKKDLFKLVILLHDIAKPETLKPNDNGETFFPGHESLGSQKAVAILSRFVLDEAQKEYITTIIANHAKAHDIVFDKKLYQQKFAQLKDDFSDIYLELLVFGYVDTRGCKLKAKDPVEFEFRMKAYSELFDKLYE